MFGDTPAARRRRLRERGLYLLFWLIGLVWLLRPRGELVEAERITWRLETEVERLQVETSSEWCRDLPAGIAITSRRMAEHPDAGQLERCQYSTTAWRTLWLAHEGGDRSSPQHWPKPALRKLPPDTPGAERLGRRDAFYEVVFRASDDQRWTCRLDEARWQRVPLGGWHRLPVDRWSVANCAGLKQGWFGRG
jgi:hypothetical protein